MRKPTLVGLRHGLNRSRFIEILLRARSAEICLFDTAPAYGSSQVLLGKYLPEDGVKITTKVDAISEDTITRNSVKKCSEKFSQTLEQLQIFIKKGWARKSQ